MALHMAMNQRVRTRKLVVTGMLLAVTAILIFIPNLGMIQVGVISITTIHIPVLIGVMAEGLTVGLILGLAFGLCSFIKAFSGITLFDQFFTNPLISIPSRVLVPLAAFAVMLLLNRLIQRKTPLHDKLIWSVSAICGSLTNSVVTLAILYALKYHEIEQIILNAVDSNVQSFAGRAAEYLILSSLPNCLMEAVIAGVLVPVVMTALTAIGKHR